MNRDELLELVVHYENSMEHDILSNIQIEDQNSSSESDSLSSKEKDSDMDVDKKEKPSIKISKQEEKDRASFLPLLKQGSKFDTPSKIYQSRKISWSKIKTRRFFDHYKTYWEFPQDNQSRRKFPIKKTRKRTY